MFDNTVHILNIMQNTSSYASFHFKSWWNKYNIRYNSISF